MNINNTIFPTIQALSSIPQKTSPYQMTQKDEFSSKNLLHFLKKKLRSADEIALFLSTLSVEEKYVGILPDKWREKFDRSEIKNKTKQIQHLFSDFATDSYSPKKTPEFYLAKNIEKLKMDLEEILGENCTIKYKNAGNFGKVFRIQSAGEDLALKIYHNDWYKRSKSYGGAVEIANAIALNHSLKPTQCTRFYCGKVTENTDPSAFMLTKYVEDKNDSIQETLPSFTPWTYKRFYFMDRLGKGNIIDGKIVDFGGISLKYKNYAEQNLAKKLYFSIIKGDSEAILRMKKEYANNENFRELLLNLRSVMEEPISFASLACQGSLTKEIITAFKAIGVDFSIIEQDISKKVLMTPELEQIIENLGLTLPKI